MAIHFRCGGCRHRVAARSRMVGMTARCPGCRDAIQIPTAAECRRAQVEQANRKKTGLGCRALTAPSTKSSPAMDTPSRPRSRPTLGTTRLFPWMVPAELPEKPATSRFSPKNDLQTRVPHVLRVVQVQRLQPVPRDRLRQRARLTQRLRQGVPAEAGQQQMTYCSNGRCSNSKQHPQSK